MREAARMTLDRLWAGWRATYINEVATQRPPDDDECLFERLAAADPDEALKAAASATNSMNGRINASPRRAI